MTSTQASHPSVKADAYTGDFTHRLAQVADTVETFLVDLLGPTLQAGEIARPPRLM
jgi:farnesyl diphosphate synthase